ncbi:MAG TPA: GMP/IMP nucleotidase [Gammaproteobacteria bacterium]|nr:GMP/IMP nucleotidase [Gammaproteobacteria bacterium]
MHTANINWPDVDTVFLDMDGTLLDLNFDNHFWLQHVPKRYGEKQGLTTEQARQELFPRFRKEEGTMNWYCIDFWSHELGLDIALLKQEVDHLIAVHPHVTDFLDALRQADKQVLLVTNAHMKSLELKMQKTQLAGHFDQLVCAHDYGVPKENSDFWGRLASKINYDAARTLLVDDSLAVLRSARGYGIGHLLAIRQPDTKGPVKDVEDFMAIRHFSEIMPS